MRNSVKVAKWEIKRNLKNKTFLIGLFLTPLIIIGFALLGSWIGGDADDVADAGSMDIHVYDEIGVIDELAAIENMPDLEWTITETDLTEADMSKALEDAEETAYIFIHEQSLLEGVIPVYTSDDVGQLFTSQLSLLQGPIVAYQLEELGLSEEQAMVASRGVHFAEMEAEAPAAAGEEAAETDDFLSRLIPAAFGGVIFVSILFTGMAIFQSASQEKKDKIAEILLSSLKPEELMQGKILGYFVLGLIQAAVLLVFLIPLILIQTDIPLFEYLLVPETLLFVLIAVLNYLMFAALFVGIGATIEDVSTSGNFQGLVMMLPFLPFIFIAPVISDPSGLMAQIGTYIPFTAPGVLLLRLTVLEEWPWIEILLSLGVIIISTLIFIRLAGKIFKVGILMYGKNATPGEIWKWLRA